MCAAAAAAARPRATDLHHRLCGPHSQSPPHPNPSQSNATLQSIDVSNNMAMDKSWQKLLNHVCKGKAKS
jgi:hypothetical protein